MRVFLSVSIGLFFVLLPGLASAQNQRPIADAGGDRTAFTNQGITLYGSATDPDGDEIVAWHWTLLSQPPGSFADLSPVSSRTPAFFGNTPGDYIISLVVYDGTDWSFPDTITITVADNLPPVSVVAADVTSGAVPLTVHFDGSGSYDPDGEVVRYAWDFGDGMGASFDVSPVYTYEYPGSYVARLIVRDEFNEGGVATVTITVSSPGNTPPTASPTATPSSDVAPLEVQFTANASDADGDPLTYAWDFGDPGSGDNTSTEENPSHVYSRPGTYVASLTVSDGQDEVSASLSIGAALDLSVQAAQVMWGKKNRTQARMDLLADVTPFRPPANDMLAVVADGTALFVARFSYFVADRRQFGLYELKDQFLTVTWNVTTGRLEVHRKKIDLHTLDNSNGVDIKLKIGPLGAMDNIMMTKHRHGLIY